MKNLWSVLWVMMIAMSPVYMMEAQVPTQSVQFLSMDPPHPQVQFSDEPQLYLLDTGFVMAGLENTENVRVQEDVDLAPDVTLKPYFYPNPFTLSEGAHLGYGLTDDMTVEIRFYTMLAQEIYRESFAAGTVGGLGSREGQVYNKIPFTRSEWGKPGQTYADVFGSYQLSSGIYFFVIIHENTVIAKGKFAIKPE